MNNINFISPLGMTGYGIAAHNILKELSYMYNITYFPIGQPHIDNPKDVKLVQDCINRQETFDYDAPCFKIWHQFDLGLRAGRGKFIAYPFFELDTFTTKEKHHLHHPDHLVVSSKWAKEILINNNITKPITIAPLGVDRNIFNHSMSETVDRTNLPYIFINVGKWEIRKGHEILIEMFNSAFSETDNVELWLVTENPFLNKEQNMFWAELVKNSKLQSKIRLFPRIDTHDRLAEVMSYADCGIFPSRAEGWNLELLEMMSLGKPVITTNYASHTEFCTKDNAYLVDITEKEEAYDGKWFNGEGNWAKIDQSHKDQFIEYMKYVYTNKINTNKIGIETAEKYNWKNTANCISAAIEA
jgi:glycosyltransferase involved in cell wall biosynthesis